MTPANEDARAHFVVALVEIAARVQPGLGEDQTKQWAAGIILSLSRTPMDLVAKAIEAARFKQFQYINEVGPFLEAHIAEPLRTRRTKLNRLRELEMAARALPARPEYATPEFARAEVAKLEARQAARRASIAASTNREVNWDHEVNERWKDTNFLRACGGHAPLSLDEFKETLRPKMAKADDEAGDEVFGGEG